MMARNFGTYCLTVKNGKYHHKEFAEFSEAASTHEMMPFGVSYGVSL